MIRYSRLLIFIFFCVCLVNCKRKEKKVDLNQNSNKQFTLLNTYKHDINSFTEGLFINKDIVYESTGSPSDLPSTKSELGILDLITGKINVKTELDRNLYFGEGIALCNGKIYQLTYKNKVGFVYDAKTFKKIRDFSYDNNEGWGLTNIDNDTLIMSDGTNILTFLCSNKLNPLKKISVTEYGNELHNLNELEYVNGHIYANVFGTNRIVKINPKNGFVTKSIDLTNLYFDSKNKYYGSMEMNGIAYNEKNKSFLVTGKMWPCLYEIKIID